MVTILDTQGFFATTSLSAAEKMVRQGHAFRTGHPLVIRANVTPHEMIGKPQKKQPLRRRRAA